MDAVDPRDVETDSVVELQLPIDDSLERSAAADALDQGDEFPEDFDDFEAVENPQPEPIDRTPLRAVENVVEGAGSASLESRGLLTDISNRILPSWIGWPSRGTLRGGVRRPTGPRSLPPVQRVAGRDSDRAESVMAGYAEGQDNIGAPYEGPPEGVDSIRAGEPVRQSSIGSVEDQVVQGAQEMSCLWLLQYRGAPGLPRLWLLGHL